MDPTSVIFLVVERADHVLSVGLDVPDLRELLGRARRWIVQLDAETAETAASIMVVFISLILLRRRPRTSFKPHSYRSGKILVR